MKFDIDDRIVRMKQQTENIQTCIQRTAGRIVKVKLQLRKQNIERNIQTQNNNKSKS